MIAIHVIHVESMVTLLETVLKAALVAVDVAVDEVVALAVDMAVMEATVVVAVAIVVRLELLCSLIAVQILSILPDWLAGGGGSLCLKCFQVSRPRPFKRRCSWEGCEHVLVK